MLVASFVTLFNQTTVKRVLIASVVTGLLNVPLAWSGGIVGGGGHLDEATITVEIAAEVVTHLRALLPAAFAGLEYDRGTMERLRHEGLLVHDVGNDVNGVFDSAAKKLFDGKKTVFDVLPGISWKYNADDACWVKELNEDGSASIDVKKDGSASIEENKLCLSLVSTAKKTSRYDVELRLLALAVHEVSHLLGTTEPEAEDLQKRILESGKRELMTTIGLDAKIARHLGIQNDLGRVLFDLQAEVNLPSPSVDRFCSSLRKGLQESLGLADQWLQQGSLYRGLAPARLSAPRHLNAVVVRLLHLQMLCLKETNRYKNSYSTRFGQNSSIKLKEFIEWSHAFSMAQPLDLDEKEVAHYLGRGGRGAVRQELDAAQASLRRAYGVGLR